MAKIKPTPETPETPKGKAVYKNVTKENVFTSQGRVGGGDIVELPEIEGEITKGLEVV